MELIKDFYLSLSLLFVLFFFFFSLSRRLLYSVDSAAEAGYLRCERFVRDVRECTNVTISFGQFDKTGSLSLNFIDNVLPATFS